MKRTTMALLTPPLLALGMASSLQSAAASKDTAVDKPLPELVVEFRDGSRAAGQITRESLALTTAGGSCLDVRLRGIRSIEVSENGRDVSIKYANGQGLTGTTALIVLDMTTAVGPVEVQLAKVRRIRVSEEANRTGGGAVRLGDGLTAHYCFNGDARDASGNGNHGTIRGMVDFTDGIAGQAARFHGMDARGQIEVPNSKSLQFKDAFAVAFWMRIRTEAGQSGRTADRIANAHQAVLAKRGDVIGFFVGSPGEDHPRGLALWANVRTGEQATCESALKVPAVNRWMHVAATSGHEGTRLYLDGHVIASGEKPVGFATANGQDMLIGAQSVGPFRFPFSGDLDDLRLYSRALSLDEVETLYGQGKAKAEAVNTDAGK